MAPLLESPPTPPESSDSESLSPARDALQHNLETNLTPNKKKSWLNIGGTIRKSALSIKGAIDYVRGEQSKPQDEDLKRLPSEESTSLDSTTAEHSETPKRPRMTERRSTFTPKHAVASLRQHLPRHSKRGSTHSIFKDKDTTNEAGAEGPERFSTDSHDDKEAATHTRRTSIADSIVGSVRGFGLKVSLKKAAMPGEVQLPQRRSPERSAAAAVPLPSSPINIPNAPPALSLNLGPAGFISPAFGGSPGAGREEELMYLTAVRNITSGKPESRGRPLPAELEARDSEACSSSRQKPTQSNMFHLKLHDLDFDPVVCPTRRDGLSTPMPGTNVALELDGGCESPPFFERNVELAEHSPARSDLGLRQVRSIDAMAQSRAHVGPTISSNDSTDALANAAVIAHAADEAESRAVMANVATSDAAEATLAVIEKLDTTAKTTAMAIDDELLKTEMSYTHTSPADHSPKSEPTPAPLFIPMEPHSGSRRNLTSASAVNTCPPDMAPLSRQTTPRLIDVDHGDIERWQQTTQEPSQADRYAKQQEGRRDSVVEVGAVADRGPPSPNSSVNLPYRFKAATGTSELSINASKTPPAQLTCRMIEPSPSPYVQSTEHEQVLPASNQYNDTDSVLTDYAEFKTQHIFRNDDEMAVPSCHSD
ncbi:hypothetical protein B0A55_13442 [Friedmanniomyces simplex]|uniref:Uncharacterized protein n=1 Tax=Friedmanniomyces simplex TaxID=329884 RepID=A0A4U0VPK3_9PEZI|nr:hypothetical protein B0A55_13442 [Friedmanniomyces simplex]